MQYQHSLNGYTLEVLQPGVMEWSERPTEPDPLASKNSSSMSQIHEPTKESPEK